MATPAPGAPATSHRTPLQLLSCLIDYKPLRISGYARQVLLRRRIAMQLIVMVSSLLDMTGSRERAVQNVNSLM